MDEDRKQVGPDKGLNLSRLSVWTNGEERGKGSNVYENPK
jgi:hypothetical protein